MVGLRAGIPTTSWAGRLNARRDIGTKALLSRPRRNILPQLNQIESNFLLNLHSALPRATQATLATLATGPLIFVLVFRTQSLECRLSKLVRLERYTCTSQGCLLAI